MIHRDDLPELNGSCSVCGGDVEDLPPTVARFILVMVGAPEADLLELNHAPGARVTWCEPCLNPALLFPALLP